MAKRELIEFLDGLVELASEENKVKAVWVMFLSPAKAAGIADRRLEEMQRLTAGRKAGVGNGN